MALTKIATTGEFGENAMKIVMVGKKPVIISKIDGKFYAVDAICTHMYAYLPSGTVKNGIIRCPVHGAQYDLKTGRVVGNVSEQIKAYTGREAHDLGAYQVEVEGTDIFITT